MSQIRFALFVESDFFDSIGRPSNVEYPTPDAHFLGFGFFSIRSAVRRMSNIRHPKRVRSNAGFLKVEFFLSYAIYTCQKCVLKLFEESGNVICL